MQVEQDVPRFLLQLVSVQGFVGNPCLLDLDLVKKTWVSNKPLDTDKLKQEAGDILFYLQQLCNLLGVSLEEIAAMNIAKLSTRYPNGYSDAASHARLDVTA